MAENTSNDLIVQPNEYAYIRDDTKGLIVLYVGPTKASLAGTDKPVIFNADTGPGVSPRFEPCSLQEAIKPFTNIPEGWYGVVKNPAEGDKLPTAGNSPLAVLDVGRKVNVPGPKSFALYPGQMAKVLRGHRLRSNQYLVCRVYNDEAAQANIDQTIAKPQIEEGEEEVQTASIYPDQLTMGQLFIIKGTLVSFYIPPTGIEVVANDEGSYVQDAVTLEQLEYCILLDQTGEKRYERGPQVVFPTATETFVKSGKKRKFRAIELNPQMALYIKVISDYEEEGGRAYRQGDELFLTGKDTQIYFPRPEHALIRQGESDRIFAVAVPKGEGRYVLDKNTGNVELVQGPTMLLPDPRNNVIVRRVLSPGQSDLWFPGNAKAAAHNAMLAQIKGDVHVTDRDARAARAQASGRTRGRLATRAFSSHGMDSGAIASYAAGASFADHEWAEEGVGEHFAGDEVERETSYTPPRTITIDNKFDGAVRVAVWSGYAVNVVSKSGERRTVVGPETVLLQYDEDLESFNLSTGTPKGEGDTPTMQDVYLRVHANKISDIITTSTKDLVQLKVHLSYRVSFLPEYTDRWFAVENYTKLLCEHLGSKIRNKLKHYSIREINADGFDIIRQEILGEPTEEGRPGTLFEENGMRVYDVEIFEIRIADLRVAEQISNAQHETVSLELQAVLEESRLESTKKAEAVRRAAHAEKVQSEVAILENDRTQLAAEATTKMAKEEAQRALMEFARATQVMEATARAEVSALTVAREEAEHDGLVKQRTKDQQVESARLRAQTEAYVAQIQAISPELASKLQILADSAMGTAMIREFGSHALLQGKSLTDVLAMLANGAPGMEKVLNMLPQKVQVGALPDPNEPGTL